MSGTNYSSSNTSHEVQGSLIHHDDHHLFVKPSNNLLIRYSIPQRIEKPRQQKPSTIHGQRDTVEISLFSGEKNENAEKWLDHVFEVIDQQELTPWAQRDLAAGRLAGEALFWYRLNRLNIPDMQSFSHAFLFTYASSYTTTSSDNTTPKDVHCTNPLSEATIIENELEQMGSHSSKVLVEEKLNLNEEINSLQDEEENLLILPQLLRNRVTLDEPLNETKVEDQRHFNSSEDLGPIGRRAFERQSLSYYMKDDKQDAEIKLSQDDEQKTSEEVIHELNIFSFDRNDLLDLKVQTITKINLHLNGSNKLSQVQCVYSKSLAMVINGTEDAFRLSQFTELLARTRKKKKKEETNQPQDELNLYVFS